MMLLFMFSASDSTSYMVTLRMADQLRENGGLTVNMYRIDSCFFIKSLVKPFVHAMQKEF